MDRRNLIIGGLSSLLLHCARSDLRRFNQAKIVDKEMVLGEEVWSLDGKLQGLRVFYGQPLLITTYSQGCTPCHESFPILNELTTLIKVLGVF